MPPMMPPMTGGQGGNKDQERERTTWLSEDEEVWGTDACVGVGVIGRPDHGGTEVDEPLAPTHVHLRSAAPRGRTAAGTGNAEETASAN